eukprot:m51a1_g2727 hypothetical protein (87) ;mRNA; f:872244-872625
MDCRTVLSICPFHSWLDLFFTMFLWFTVAHISKAWIMFQNSAVSKQLRVQQELQNFDVETWQYLFLMMVFQPSLIFLRMISSHSEM